ncbi:MAG: hypothetical protein JEZ06_13285 [Anaerolineaceae bacterium]|nr:hypothetical protein [Anaerolineaceae bacterium]
MKENNRTLYQKITAILLIVAVNLGTIFDIYGKYKEELSRGNRLPISLYLLIAFLLGIECLLLLEMFKPDWLSRIKNKRSKFSWVNWAIAILIGYGSSWILLISRWSYHYSGNLLRFAFFLAVVILMGFLISRDKKYFIEWNRLLTALILLGAVFTICNASRTAIDYPFRLHWSEGNRFYDYSLVFGQRIYDSEGVLPLGGLTGRGRSTIWGLPFIFDNVSIQFFRFWDELVYVVPGLVLGWIAIKKTEFRKHFGFYFLFGCWAMLFLNQGPIYAPLILAAWLIVLTRYLPLWIGFFIAALSGYYAEGSRFTWMFAPAIWAGLIAFVEINPISIKQRWTRAITLTCGGLLGGFVIPNFITEVLHLDPSTTENLDVGIFQPLSTLSRQPLLWERLWPNPTFASGIVLGLLLAVGTVTVLFVISIRSELIKLDNWQKVAIAGCLIVLMSVGLVISVKIGGGSNLHNLDMFLITLFFMVVILLEGNVRKWVSTKEKPTLPITILVLLSISLPYLPKFLNAHPIEVLDENIVEDYLIDVVDKVDDAKREGDVLFIDQRQLLTFKYITDVELIHDYEKKLLMDMAMAGDEQYFETFYDDLKAQRFSMIISEPLLTGYKGDEFEFGNENDAWVKWVSIPVLCYYERETTHQEIGLEILYPKVPISPVEGEKCP